MDSWHQILALADGGEHLLDAAPGLAGHAALSIRADGWSDYGLVVDGDDGVVEAVATQALVGLDAGVGQR